MSHATPFIATIAAGLVLAFVFGFIAGKLRISPILGYLLSGMVIGPYTTGFVSDQKLALELAEMGVIFLMFGVGLHFSPKDLLSVKGIAVPGAVAQIAVATLLGLALAAWMGWTLAGGLVFGLSLSVASTVVLLRALEERGMLDTGKGRIAVGWLIVEDLATVLALVLLPALAAAFASDGGFRSPETGEVLATAALTIGKVVLFVVFMLAVGRKAVPKALAAVAATGSRETFTLAVLAIALGIAYGSASLFGVSFALGAFFAGMVLAESELSQRAAEDTLPLRDAFAVLFFVSVGMLIDPAVFVEHPLAVAGTAAIVLFGKSAAAYVIVRAFGHGRSIALTVSASLAQVGEFSFVLIGLGISLGLVKGEARDLVLAASMITIVVNPLLFALLDRFEVLADGSDSPNEGGRAGANHAVIIGFGDLGKRVAAGLSEMRIPVVVLDAAPRRVDAARERGYSAVLGNGTAVPGLRAADVARARCVVIAAPGGLEAGAIAAAVRLENPGVEIMGVAASDAEAAEMARNGAGHVLNRARMVAEDLIRRVRISGRDSAGD